MSTIRTSGHDVNQVPGYAEWANWWRAQMVQNRTLDAFTVVNAAAGASSRTDAYRRGCRFGLGDHSARRAGNLWKFLHDSGIKEEMLKVFVVNNKGGES